MGASDLSRVLDICVVQDKRECFFTMNVGPQQTSGLFLKTYHYFGEPHLKEESGSLLIPKFACSEDCSEQTSDLGDSEDLSLSLEVN
jgi:hypothetical protein